MYRRNSHIILLICTQQRLYHHQPGWYTGVVSIPRDSLEQRSYVTYHDDDDDDDVDDDDDDDVDVDDDCRLWLYMMMTIERDRWCW